jgi:sec-independent protein translocase protein TatA
VGGQSIHDAAFEAARPVAVAPRQSGPFGTTGCRSQSPDFAAWRSKPGQPAGGAPSKGLVGRRPLDYVALPAVLVEDNDWGSLSLTHWLVVMLVILIVFGAGKLPRLMGDLATGIKAFKRNLKEDGEPESVLSATASPVERRPAESR